MIRSRTAKAGVLASGQVLTAGASLITFVVLSRLFEPADYATYRQTLLVYNFAGPLLALGLPSALYYFLAQQPQRSRGVLAENLLLLGSAGLLFSIFLVLGGNRLLSTLFNNPSLERSLLLFALYPALILPTASVAACLMTADRPVSTALFNFGSRFAMVIGVVGAALFWGRPEYVAFALSLTGVLTLPVALVLMTRACREGRFSPTTEGAWGQLCFSVPLGLATMLSMLNLRIGHLIVAAGTTPEDFAVFANGAMEIPLIGIVTGSATAVLLPEMSRQYRDGRYAETLALWQRSAYKTALILFPAMVILFIVAEDLMVLLYSETYRSSALPFRILLLLLPIRIANYGAIFQAAGNSRLVLTRAALSVAATLVVVPVFVKFFGTVGAVWAIVLVLYVITIPFCLVKAAQLLRSELRRMLPYRKLLALLGWCLLAGCAAIAVRFPFPEAGATGGLAVSVAVFFTVLGIVYHFMDVIDVRTILGRLSKRVG